MELSLAKEALSRGGSIIPLIVPFEQSEGTGLMNPSIYLDGGYRLLVVIRHLNYVLYHSENMKFPHTYGPLQYLHPENDVHLRTKHFISELDRDTLEPKYYKLIDTSKFDKPFNCEFIGLEDPRLFRWDNKLYMCGVRRDADEKGYGRMELSELKEVNGNFIEISRQRIPTPNNVDTYCEKNWVPILDTPFHFIKWTNPMEIVNYDIESKTTSKVYSGIDDVRFKSDLRGGSQVINYNEYKVSVMHETYGHPSEAGNKNATYRHRIIFFDDNYNIVKYSNIFNFMDAQIEFCCGLVFIDGCFIFSFGFQDNAAFILKVPEQYIRDMVGLDE